MRHDEIGIIYIFACIISLTLFLVGVWSKRTQCVKQSRNCLEGPCWTLTMKSLSVDEHQTKGAVIANAFIMIYISSVYHPGPCLLPFILEHNFLSIFVAYFSRTFSLCLLLDLVGKPSYTAYHTLHCKHSVSYDLPEIVFICWNCWIVLFAFQCKLSLLPREDRSSDCVLSIV